MSDDNYHGDYAYRFIAARGLERRRITSTIWHAVDGAILELMTADELEHCAKVMRGAKL